MVMMASGIDVKLGMSLDDLIKSKAVQAKKDAKPQARKQGGAAPKSLVGGKGVKPKAGNAPKSLQAGRVKAGAPKHLNSRVTPTGAAAKSVALKAKRAGASPAPIKLAHGKASLMRPTAGRVVKVAKSAPKVLLAKRIVNKARGRASGPQLVQVAPKSLVNSGKPKQQKQAFQQQQQPQAPKSMVGLPRQQQKQQKQQVQQRPPPQQQQRQQHQHLAQQQHKLTAAQRMAQQRGQFQANRRTGSQQAAGKANRAPINMQPQQQWTVPKGPARGTMHVKGTSLRTMNGGVSKKAARSSQAPYGVSGSVPDTAGGGMLFCYDPVTQQYYAPPASAAATSALVPFLGMGGGGGGGRGGPFNGQARQQQQYPQQQQYQQQQQQYSSHQQYQQRGGSGGSARKHGASRSRGGYRR